MKANNVPKDLLFRFVRNIIYPSITYGAFIDKEDAKEDYELMDDGII